MSRFASLFTEAGEAQPASAAPAPAAHAILLVDDEPNVVKALERVFRQENYRVLTAANGREALARLAAEPVQLVISDFKMPGMNGGELLREVRTRHPDVIRIMLTGHADADAVAGAVKEGAVYKFILKPWNDDDLRVTVALALEQHELRRRNRDLAQQNRDKAKEIQSLSKLAASNRSQLAIMLHKRNLLSDQQVQELYREQQVRREPMLKLLLARGWVAERTLRDILRQDFRIEEVALAEFQVEPALSALVPRSFCERQWVLPLKQDGRRLLLAMADPLDLGLIDELRFVTGLEIQAVMADAEAIKGKLAEIYGGTASVADLEALLPGDPLEGIEVVIEEDDSVPLDELLRGSDEPPAIRLVNAVILEAIRLGASDIHIQPRAKNVVVRLRLDGVLVDKIQIPHNMHLPLVSRIKVMAELDITERRRPQDGRITVKTPMRIVDMRLSTLPTINGEKVVMRVLDRQGAIQKVADLGFCADDLARVLHVVSRPQGIVLATGPTGSGKTTTLYSLLQHDATAMKNYVTIEDPVECYMDMAGQVAVRERVGLDFTKVLRAILRQDPDVILLGEIRDLETAEVAFNAALTGHLVYSTLHTNSAVATIARLVDLGLKPFVIASALECIVAQRLVRRVCPQCREPAAGDELVIRRLGPVFSERPPASFRGKGCPACRQTGYQGRIALFEVLVPDEELKHLIASGGSTREINRWVKAQNLSTLLEDARSKVDQGLTSIEEILRVLGSQVVV